MWFTLPCKLCRTSPLLAFLWFENYPLLAFADGFILFLVSDGDGKGLGMTQVRPFVGYYVPLIKLKMFIWDSSSRSRDQEVLFRSSCDWVVVFLCWGEVLWDWLSCSCCDNYYDSFAVCGSILPLRWRDYRWMFVGWRKLLDTFWTIIRKHGDRWHWVCTWVDPYWWYFWVSSVFAF